MIGRTLFKNSPCAWHGVLQFSTSSITASKRTPKPRRKRKRRRSWPTAAMRISKFRRPRWWGGLVIAPPDRFASNTHTAAGSTRGQCCRPNGFSIVCQQRCVGVGCMSPQRSRVPARSANTRHTTKRFRARARLQVVGAVWILLGAVSGQSWMRTVAWRMEENVLL